MAPPVDPSEQPRPAASKGRAAFILLCLFVTLVLFGMKVLWTSRLKIAAVSKAGEYRLAGTNLHPTRLRVHVSGWIDGQATLTIPRHDPAPIGPGAVEWRFSDAWAEPECLLKYSPGTVTLGSLEVEYHLD